MILSKIKLISRRLHLLIRIKERIKSNLRSVSVRNLRGEEEELKLNDS